MNYKENKDLVERYFASAQQEDVSALLETLHPDAELHIPESLPFGGICRGHTGFREALPKMMSAWRKLEIQRKTVAGNEEYVIVLTATRNTSKANGAEGEVRIAEVFQLCENKIVSLQPYYFDTAQMKQVFGWK